jgi:uncharacterized protein (DUF433 family)
MTNISYPHITVDEDGTVRVGQTRYKVLHLAAEHYHHGWSAEELLRQHPDLRPEEVYAALTYFYDHHDEMVAAMHDAAVTAESLRSAATVSREELLRRKKGAR